MSIVLKERTFPFKSFFDDYVSGNLMNRSEWANGMSTMPMVNIVETGDDFRVEMAAPGMKKDDFHVRLEDDYLTIFSERNQQEEVNYTMKEFAYNGFERTFHLPNTVEIDKIEAKYRDGILSLIIPKKEEARKMVRTIKIS